MGGETADIGDLVRTAVIDSTFAARLKRDEVIEINIKPGNVIVGLASYGRAKYETEYNAGMGSNGLTSARHDLLNDTYKANFPESYDSLAESDYFYTGKFSLTDILPGTEITMGKAILSPTRTYAPLLKEIIDNYRSQIKGIIHCTGGGQTKVMKFVNQLEVVKNNLLPVPPLFKTIQETTGTLSKEMFEVFNMGHRMEIYTDEKTAHKITDLASAWGIESQIVGECKPAVCNTLSIFHNHENLIWKYP
jgi:phosphoribosylformylglycinamidine cyclo-ligase